MCRFKLSNNRDNHTSYYSFNTSYVSVQAVTKLSTKVLVFVSIHHMCRFKPCVNAHPVTGSCFNTSYVSVQVVIATLSALNITKFQYIICVGSSFKSAIDKADLTEFQYIICVGSS